MRSRQNLRSLKYEREDVRTCSAYRRRDEKTSGKDKRPGSRKAGEFYRNLVDMENQERWNEWRKEERVRRRVRKKKDG